MPPPSRGANAQRLFDHPFKKGNFLKFDHIWVRIRPAEPVEKQCLQFRPEGRAGDKVVYRRGQAERRCSGSSRTNKYLSSGLQEGGDTPTSKYHQSTVRDHPVLLQVDTALGSLLYHTLKHDHGVLVSITGGFLLPKSCKSICCHLLLRSIRSPSISALGKRHPTLETPKNGFGT